MSRGRATAIGFGAVLLWAALALFTVGAGPVPPFLLSAICFAIGGVLGIGWAAFRGVSLAGLVRRLPPAVWLVGVGGLFGYHFAYFTALQNAPPEQASLIAYLWPLLIVLFSGLLPGERLRAGHVAGAVVAFVGAGLVVAGPGMVFDPAAGGGYLAAAACALIWSGYSVLSRRFGTVQTEAVALFCIGSAVLSLVAHLALERTVWPDGARAWVATLALGLGPVGLAFFLWDVGVKRGDIQMLGVASYAAPLLSTLLLIATGFAQPTLSLVLAAGLIAGGALIAARAGR